MQKNPSSKNHRESFVKTPTFTLKFRLAVTFILGMIAGGIVVDKCSGDKADQPKQPGIADTSKTGGEAPPSPPEPPEPDDEVDFSQCRNLVFKVTHPECGEDEIKRRYLERRREELEKWADKIIKKLGIHNPNDQDKIREAVLNGCTEFGKISGNLLVLEPPPPMQYCHVMLEEESEKDWLDISEEEYEKLSHEEKRLVDLYRDKKYEDTLEGIRFTEFKNKIDELTENDGEFVDLGLADDYNNDFDMLSQAQEDMIRAQSQEERLKILCKLFVDIESKPWNTDEQIDKIQRLMEEEGIDLTDFDDTTEGHLFFKSLFALAGISSEDELGSSEVCRPILEEAFGDELFK